MNLFVRFACCGAVVVSAVFSGGARGDAPITRASADGVWLEIDETVIAARATRLIVPQQYRTLRLDQAALDAKLADVSQERAVAAKYSTSILTLPTPEGAFARFSIVESPIMAPELARRYPELRTYLGQGIDDKSATLRFDTTPAGFHAQVLSAKGSWYVDPWQSGDTDHYIAYARRDYTRDSTRVFSCGVVDAEGEPQGAIVQHAGAPQPATLAGDTLRTFRLAVAATGEYTQFHGGTVAASLAGIVTTMNRVNGLYEREAAVRMVLVANNDLIVYTDGATDPYTNSNGSTMLGQNQTNLNNVIGSANFDIGHVFSTGGGGVASLGSVCSTTNKARGVTGSGQPLGDAFDVDYVAHEIGHQFNAPHTFNSQSGSCAGGNRSAGSAYETGSGTTIMAYAGICSVENLQPNSDDYFHRHSLTRIIDFVATRCGVATSTGNAAPTVDTPAAFTIPARTPFALTAIGNDSNGDTLTYLWEQFDLGAATTGGASIVDDGSRPLFRPTDPLLAPTREFPSLRYILENANVPPASAPLPGTTTPVYYTGEALPTTNRTLNFRVTARDNRAGGGGTSEASTALTVSAAAGPFAVTAPNTAVTVWSAGSTQAVTWSVANTDQAPISTAQVRITMSLDGGNTFPVVLAASTANDGDANITVPAAGSSLGARVRVQAVGNVFFDVSDASFVVNQPANSPPTITATGSVSTRQGSPASVGNVATVADAQDAAGSIAVSVSGAPPELALSAANNTGTIALTATAACSLVAPTSGSRRYPVLLTVADSAGGTASTAVNVEVGSNLAPTAGAYGTTSAFPGRVHSILPLTAPADPNSNLTGASIAPATLAGGVTLAIAASGVVTLNAPPGATPGTYRIRVFANDSCDATDSTEFDLRVFAPGELFGDSFE